MQIKITTLILVTALAAAMAATMGAGASFTRQLSVTFAKQLSGKSFDADQSLLANQWARRGNLAAALIGMARSPHVAERASAMYLLGVDRIAKAVPVLAAEVQFYHLFKVGGLPARGTSIYPAVQALARIGAPAIPAMVENLETTGKPDVAACSAWVIRKVEGRRLGACVIRLALQNNMPRLEKVRLRAAMAAIGSKSWSWDGSSPIKLPVRWPVGGPAK